MSACHLSSKSKRAIQGLHPARKARCEGWRPDFFHDEIPNYPISAEPLIRSGLRLPAATIISLISVKAGGTVVKPCTGQDLSPWNLRPAPIADQRPSRKDGSHQRQVDHRANRY